MTRISNAELEVMEIVWEKKEVTSLEIIKELNSDKWNENTIRTLINRLTEKKAIGIAKKVGKTYTYVPLIERKKYIKFVTKTFINKMFNGSIEDFIICLVKDNEDAYKELCDLIENL